MKRYTHEQHIKCINKLQIATLDNLFVIRDLKKNCKLVCTLDTNLSYITNIQILISVNRLYGALDFIKEYLEAGNEIKASVEPIELFPWEQH